MWRYGNVDVLEIYLHPLLGTGDRQPPLTVLHPNGSESKPYLSDLDVFGVLTPPILTNIHKKYLIPMTHSSGVDETVNVWRSQLLLVL